MSYSHQEKELKEASRVKDHRSVDIFALAGVNLPKSKSSLSTAGTTFTQSRQDSASNSNDSRHEPPVKRPRVQKVSGAGAGTGIETGTGVGTGPGMEKKLKRSSMAVRNAAASKAQLHGSNTGESSEKLVWPLFSCSLFFLTTVTLVITQWLLSWLPIAVVVSVFVIVNVVLAITLIANCLCVVLLCCCNGCYYSCCFSR